MNNSISNTVRSHALLVFVLLTFLFSWGFWLSAKFGWSADGGIFPLGPLIAALLTILIAAGFRGLGAYLKRCFSFKGGALLWLGAILLPFVVDGCAAALTVATGAPAPTQAALAAWPQALAAAPVILLFIALGEEPAWRGFLQQKVQGLAGPLAAVAVVWAIWATWHWPLYGLEMDAKTFPAFLVGLTGATVVSAFITNRAKGGVIPVMLFHTTVNVLGGKYVFRMFEGADQVRLWWFFALMWVLIGGAVLIATRGRIGYDPVDRYDPVAMR
jgi:membrane protease YdiL (CAAX protease family)